MKCSKCQFGNTGGNPLNRLEISKRYTGWKKLAIIAGWLKDRCKPENGLVQGLDAGCGRGDITLLLSYLGYQMVGFDISPEAIWEAERNKEAFGKPTKCLATFLTGNIEDLNITVPQSGFHFCICSEVLEHVQHPEKALACIFAALEPEGFLIITVPNGYGPYSLLYDYFKSKLLVKMIPSLKPSEHIQMFAYSRIKKYITNAGFRVEKVRHSDFVSFLPFLVKNNDLCQLDCRLADLLPAPLVSGWYFLCQKENLKKAC